MEITAKSQETAIDYKNFYYPPGGILIWIVIFLEVITFGLGLIGMVYYANQEPEIFHQSRQQLNLFLGTSNTLILLTSGLFMATAVHWFKQGNIQKAGTYFRWTLMGGGLFMLIKGLEYVEKINAGLILDSNMFFTFYWILTAFHLIHVLIGMVILGWINFKMKKSESSIAVGDVEAGAAFWHMCDLIWLLLFPTLYLLF